MTMRMRPDAWWGRNVKTKGSGNLSLLHEYAVGLIWDAWQAAQPPQGSSVHSPRTVKIPTIDGESGDLTDGVRTISIPSSLQPVGGMYPDLVGMDANGQVKWTVEVVVSHPPDPNSIARLEREGVKVYVIRVRDEDDLIRLANCYPRPPRRRNTANQFISQLIGSLRDCDPRLRREFLGLFSEINQPQMLIPLSKNNPKAETINRFL